MRTVITLPNQAGVDDVFLRVRAQFCQCRLLGQTLGKRADVKVFAPNILGDDGIHQRIHRGQAQGFEHVLLFGGIESNVAGGESC